MNTQPAPDVLFTQQQIATAVKKLAAEVERDYRDKNPLLIGILKGAFVFMADLARALDFPLEVDFVRLSSYGGASTAGELKLLQETRSPIEGRHVIVVEDIVDTGHCVAFLLDYLGKKTPASLRLCVLADKPSRRECLVAIDYLGLTVPDKFVVGYGMDWNEKFRNLPYIGFVELGK